MNKNDEQLISQFMQANKNEIADKGFSRRVMHKLPKSGKIWSDVLTAICVILCCILIYVYDGIYIILHSLSEIFKAQSMTIINHPNNTQLLLVMIATIGFLSVRSVWTIKE